MEKQTIKDLVQQALEKMMPKVGELTCDVRVEKKPTEVILGTASDTVKILFILMNQKKDECEILCRKRRSPEEEEAHFDLHVVTDVLSKLFWNELQFWVGSKNYDVFDGFGIRPNWQIVGFLKNSEITPVAQEVSGVSLFSVVMEKVAEKMKTPMPEKIEAGGELQADQADLGEMTDYEKALALIFFEVSNEHKALVENDVEDLAQVFEKAILTEIASVLFKEEVKFRLGQKTKDLSQMTFLDNWHVAGEEGAEEDTMMAMMIGSSPLGMAIVMAAISRAFDED